MGLVSAFAFAKTMHHDQRRKGFGSAFLAHPMAVAALVIEYGGYDPEDEVVRAALLHDIIEDTPVTERQLAHAFSPRIATMVSALTHEEGLRGKEKRLAYIDRIRAVEDHGVVVISACDKLDNLRSILHAQRCCGAEEYRSGMWYYHELLKVYEEHDIDESLLMSFRDTLKRVEDAFTATTL